jgi:hypothetical protein
MKLSVFFRWFDLWIGAYWDRTHRALYVCPIPMFGVKLQFKKPCSNCHVMDRHESWCPVEKR